jgi:endonuclease/exonuclease/phosphatase family metal-dependent hydrolase
VLSNVHPQPISFERIYGVTHPSLMERTIGLVPGTAPAGEAHMVRAGYFHAYSAHPIRRWASAYLGTQESWLEDDTRGGGSVLMLEIDAPDGPLIVWAVDMPSTIGASRRDMFERMRAEVDAVARVSAIDPVGRWRPGDLGEQDPLRTPDLIVGDFNTPSHAWSVRRFARGTRDARADAGVGPPGTFPAAGGVPLFPIDAARLGPSVRATHARSVRCGGCRHLGLVLDLERPG